MKEEKLLKIINHYGVNNQLRKLSEEYFELTEAILEYEHNYGCGEATLRIVENDRTHIVEEISDLMVLLEQFKLYYGISSEEITKIFWEKVDRQLHRMEEENEKTTTK